ncbi:response regulator [Paenibacillus sp. LHD-117]|uniref:response regulator transcription factor n=1 Tax=Paenibacillus sp. LHD-117 TaxID=3071412 RepID=UPI0027E1DAB2|nr:response regulator [Paenibacillus sp. LHD-117]MDQ6419431.1 response regulator [Paenibacillus sp. LHD-117]
MNTILVVDDEPRTREGVKKVLEGWSAGRSRIVTAANGIEALAWLEGNEAALMITDIRMPELGGLDLVERVSQLPHPPQVIVISGHPEFDYARRAMQYGVIEYLLKPIDKIKLVQAVESALKRKDERLRVERMEKLVDPKLLETVQNDNAYSLQVQEAIRFMEVRLDQQLSLRDIADHLHMNASYFSVLFKEQTGLTFTEYLTRRRMQRAKELLSGTRATIAEIAEKVGYQTDKYFLKVFRNVEGVSPGQYRKNVVYREETIQ